MIENITGIMILDLWNVIYVLLLCIVITATILTNVIVSLRAGFYFKSFRDPINAIKKENNLKEIYDRAQEQEEIAGNRL